jgi:hypothetical protein
MYTLNELKDYANVLGFKTAEQAEKDYLQELLLKMLYSKIPGEMLVFRGGTALSKVYSTGRFSSDLDFVLNAAKKVDIEKEIKQAIKLLSNFYECKFEKETYREMIGYEIKVNGPLYTEKNESSKQKISIDINTYEKVVLPPLAFIKYPIYSDITPYTLVIKQLEEILFDKLLALNERKNIAARDLYDIYVILKKRLPLDHEKIDLLFNKEYKTFTLEQTKKRIDLIKPLWKQEISQLTSNFIDFETVKAYTAHALSTFFH